jgi:hypothetical protein
MKRMGYRPHVLLTVLALTCVSLAPAPPTPARSQPGIEDKSRALLEKWQERFDAERFNYLVAGPFVIAGDGSAAKLARYRDNTILAATRALRATYFDAELSEPVLILLFERAGPYKRLAKKWFDDDDVPHFGFFRRSDHVMLMNVGTGTGTLVHELVHALMAPDFPDVPDWFNEGLASLYEQCSLSDDTINGHENWRLPDLQDAIRKDRLRPLSEMIQAPRFYDDKLVGLNYAQARYLMLYLQEKGLLTDYYRRFREAVKDDPRGLTTLKQVLKSEDLEKFDAAWRRWVLTLRFG